MSADMLDGDPLPVRNEAHKEGDNILVLRHFTIQAGSFAEFHRVSSEGVWPFFEKIGARIVGMWKVISPEIMGEAADKSADEGDEVYLLTRYASADHWRATRDFWKLGGNGPDALKVYEALKRRRELTLAVSFKVLEGDIARNGHISCRALERLTYYQKRSSSWCLWLTSRHGSSEQPMDLAMGVG